MMRAALSRLIARGQAALQRLRLANTDRRIRQVEGFLGYEQEMHSEQMLMLRTELQRLRDLRIVQAGEAHQYTSGALQ